VFELLAAAGQGAPADALSAIVASFAGYGVVGAVAIALGFVTWRAWRRDQERSDDALARERERADRAETANAELNREVRERVFPALQEAARVMADVVQALRDLDRR
jgi:hypothetical protein